MSCRLPTYPMHLWATLSAIRVTRVFALLGPGDRRVHIPSICVAEVLPGLSGLKR